MPQITGAGIVLPKLTENNHFYTENLKKQAEKSSDNKEKSHSEIKWRIGETESPPFKTQNPNSIPIRPVLPEVKFNTVPNPNCVPDLDYDLKVMCCFHSCLFISQ